ncbi:type II toxin-antitoxin system RelE/ParE family toxin [Bosea sp. 124]|uniref:type II toxin-antitoxin system RelE/ParE family toxin n=1 Tax=Bosea sp. 124 TaxID=2135642 RepID=UPI000D362B54|nr:type II toxin-antitoxin system RelE/ParE family toxin [Bosea sp. 124]
MRLAFTPTARRDLQEIGDYIARDSWQQALRFVIGLERFCAGLVSQPERYPLLPQRSDRQVRRAPHQDYLIFYASARRPSQYCVYCIPPAMSAGLWKASERSRTFKS